MAWFLPLPWWSQARSVQNERKSLWPQEPKVETWTEGKVGFVVFERRNIQIIEGVALQLTQKDRCKAGKWKKSASLPQWLLVLGNHQHWPQADRPKNQKKGELWIKNNSIVIKCSRQGSCWQSTFQGWASPLHRGETLESWQEINSWLFVQIPENSCW